MLVGLRGSISNLTRDFAGIFAGMTLGQFIADCKIRLLAELESRVEPSFGTYDVHQWPGSSRVKQVQIGSATPFPHNVEFEFILTLEEGSEVFTISVPAPERIVYMPVPEWVLISVWQGEVSGSYHFESDATRMTDRYVALLTSGTNESEFNKTHKVGRS